MRNKLLVAGTLALAMTCTTVFSSITPAVVKGSCKSSKCIYSTDTDSRK